MTAPPPVITTRETWPAWDEAWYPSGPRAFAKRTRSAGWLARIAFSRGYVPGQAQDTYVVRDIIGVWVDGYGRRAVAFWERNPEAEFSVKKQDSGTIKSGEIPSGMAWSSVGTAIILGAGVSYTYAGLKDLDAWVEVHGNVDPSWYVMIQAWVLAHEEHARRKAKTKASNEAQEREDAARAR